MHPCISNDISGEDLDETFSASFRCSTCKLYQVHHPNSFSFWDRRINVILFSIDNLFCDLLGWKQYRNLLFSSPIAVPSGLSAANTKSQLCSVYRHTCSDTAASCAYRNCRRQNAVPDILRTSRAHADPRIPEWIH